MRKQTNEKNKKDRQTDNSYKHTNAPKNGQRNEQKKERKTDRQLLQTNK